MKRVHIGAIVQWFCLSSGVILSIAGMAKIWSAFGNAEILRRIDPIVHIPFGHLMFVAGIIEITVAVLCLLSKSKLMPTTIVGSLASALLTYRLGLWWIGWRRPCLCLGNLTDALHISPQIADITMKIALAYLFLGSYASFFVLWRQHKQLEADTPMT